MSPDGPLPRPGWRALCFDAVLALALGLLSFQAATDTPDVPGPRPPAGPGVADLPPMPEIPPYLNVPTPEPGGSSLGAALLVFVLCAPLVLRRRYPLTVLWLTMVSTLLLLVPDTIQRPNLYVSVVLVCLVAVYSAAAHSPYRIAVLLSLPAPVLLVALSRSHVLPTMPDGYLPFLIVAPMIAAAGGHHVWKRRAGEDRKLLAEQELRQAEALKHAAADERARIARELHDVVTHHVSVMVIQAGAARSVLGSSPEQARDALLAVESTGRAALTELRDVMGLLNPDMTGPRRPQPADLIGEVRDEPAVPPEAVALDPQPGLDAVPALVRRMCAAGLPVELTVRGEPRPVPSGVELAAYRVVQEALTNTVRHAAGASAAVTVEYAGDGLRVEVSDTGGESTVDGTGGGRGLIGLRERVAVYGGTLRAGLRPGTGGYRVEALIPLEVQ